MVLPFPKEYSPNKVTSQQTEEWRIGGNFSRTQSFQNECGGQGESVPQAKLILEVNLFQVMAFLPCCNGIFVEHKNVYFSAM